MCGRYTQTMSGEEIAASFDLTTAPEPQPRYNIAPSQPISAIAERFHGKIAQPVSEREYRIFQWGLVPSWAKEPAIGTP